MKSIPKIIAVSAAALAVAVAGAVYAQPGGGPGWMGGGAGMGWGGGPGMGWGMHGGMGGPGWMGGGRGPMGSGMRGGMSASDIAAVTANRTAELKSELKIAPAQESAWKAYEAAVQQQAGAMQTMHAQMQALWQSQTSPGSADFTAQRDAMIKLHDSAWAGYNTALKDLYAVLTPEQKAIADRGAFGMRGPWGGRNRPAR
jgi:hypothetical protein